LKGVKQKWEGGKQLCPANYQQTNKEREVSGEVLRKAEKLLTVDSEYLRPRKRFLLSFLLTNELTGL
jgi:hypothetical protein